MSKKKEMLIVGFVSATLFTGLTAYTQINYSSSKSTTKGAASQPPANAAQAAPAVQTGKPQMGNPQTTVDQPSTDPAPSANPARRKNTRTKAS